MTLVNGHKSLGHDRTKEPCRKKISKRAASCCSARCAAGVLPARVTQIAVLCLVTSRFLSAHVFIVLSSSNMPFPFDVSSKIYMALIKHRIWISASAVIVVIVLFYTSRYASYPSLPPSRSSWEPTRNYHPNNGAFDGTWNFTRDARNLLLNHDQCDLAFPRLFQEIDRPVSNRRSRPITLKEIEGIQPMNGYIRAMIYDQQVNESKALTEYHELLTTVKLYIIATEGQIYSRGLATLHALHRAILTSPDTLPNIEFTFNVDDKIGPIPQWAYARRESDTEIWVMPDFGFWSWPETKIGSYSEVQLKATMMDSDWTWSLKINKLLWRGATMGLELRDKFVEVTQNKKWADVKALDWHDKESMTSDLKSMDEHCQYKFLAHTEGNSYSGRLKYLQNCRSVIVAHTMDWIQHHHPLMESSGAEQNYVEVERSFGNLEKTMEQLQANSDTEKIAERNVATFRERYLTLAAEACYWRRLITGWAEVSFQPELYNSAAGGQKVLRGLPVESYMLERRLEWDPY